MFIGAHGDPPKRVCIGRVGQLKERFRDRLGIVVVDVVEHAGANGASEVPVSHPLDGTVAVHDLARSVDDQHR